MSGATTSRVLYLIEERPTIVFFEQLLRKAVHRSTPLSEGSDAGTAEIRELLSRIAALQAAGFACEVSSTAVDPIDKVTTSVPALIILDVIGYTRKTRCLQRALKQHPSTRDVPLIILTKDKRPPSRVRAEEIGVQSYLINPARPEELYAEIRRIGVTGRGLDSLQTAPF